jgi:putative DNA methylase
MGRLAGAMGRQALPMQWSFAETNPLAGAGGDIAGTAVSVADNLHVLGTARGGSISNLAAQQNAFSDTPIVISTDPPYYDNIGYADLSDFFYVWLRRSMYDTWPRLFRRLMSPKDEELVATPYRHGGREAAEEFFMLGMSRALEAMRRAATDNVPLAIFYAFKQAEAAEDGVTSAGWASFLQAVVDAGLAVDGTRPLRTEATNALKANINALASSVVLVRRKRTAAAPVVTRAEFIRALKRELPDAIDDIRKAGVGPVDMQQSVIGPGMGVFPRYAKVLESDDSPMTVRTGPVSHQPGLGGNRERLDTNFDPETQVAVAWFASYGYETRKSGELNVVANAKNVPERALFEALVFKNLHGNTSLTPRAELPLEWSPSADKHLTVWRCMQQTARMLKAEEGGGEATAKLIAQMGSRSADAQKLAYRLFEISTKRGMTDEALVYNELAQEWAHLEDLAVDLSGPRSTEAARQHTFDFDGSAI